MKEELKRRLEVLSIGKKWDLTNSYGIDLIDKMVDYAIGLSNVTNNMLLPEYIIEKLGEIEIIRIGEFKDDDANIKYKNIAVTSPKYNLNRPNSQTIIFNSDFKSSIAIVLFNKKQQLHNGEMITFNGLDLTNNQEVVQNLFNELTHALSFVSIKTKGTKDLTVHQIDTENNIYDVKYCDALSFENRLFFNAITNGNYDDYMGINTSEYSFEKHNIIHYDFLNEGFTNVITNKILKQFGMPEKEDKNKEINELANKLIDKSGADTIIAKYIINSRKLLLEYETHLIDNGLDLIHFICTGIKKSEDGNELIISDEYKTKCNEYISNGPAIRKVPIEKMREFQNQFVLKTQNRL